MILIRLAECKVEDRVLRVVIPLAEDPRWGQGEYAKSAFADELKVGARSSGETVVVGGGVL